jgi:hypothetical protein
MSASSEALLFQIIELEKMILEYKSQDKNSIELEETLSLLKDKFTLMNEALNKSKGLLNG